MNRSTTSYLFAVDLLILGGYGLLLPIFALFLVDRLPDANIQSVAAAAAVWFVSYAAFAWIISLFLQHSQPESRARAGLVAGTALSALVPLVYLYAKDMGAIYAAQLILGLGAGLAKPSWTFLMHRLADERHHKTLRKIRQLASALVTSAAAALGGLLASRYGFDRLIFMMVGIGVCAAVISLVAALTPNKK